MFLLILKYWQPIASAILTAFLAYGLHSLDVNRLEAKERADLIAQSDAINAECKKDKAITEGVSNEYQLQINALNSQLLALRMLPSTCIAVQPSNPTTGHHAAATGQSARKNGITSQALYDYAGDAEKYRLQLIGCQSFIRETWREKGQ